MANFIAFLVMSGGILCGMSYFAYKSGAFGFGSWEEAVKGLVLWLKTACTKGYYFLTDTIPPEKQVNRWILLSDTEIKELVEEFKRNLYILPRMDGWQIEKNGILRIQISALDVLKQYQEMTNETYQVIAERIIQKFYFDIRNRPVFLFVESVTNHHLHFSIPLTQEGLELLRRSEAKRQENRVVEMPVEPLEEDVHISDYMGRRTDDFRNESDGLSGVSDQDSGQDYPAEKNE